MKHLTRGLAIVAAALLSFGAFAQSKTNIFVASGPTTGVYYPLGGGLADVLTKYIPHPCNCRYHRRLDGESTADRPEQSRRRILDGGRDSDAYKGQGKFQDKPVNVRALMVLYPNRMHVVTVEGTGISKIADLKGKRVSTGAPNSATQIMAYRVLEAYGIDPEKDIIRDVSIRGKSAEAIKDRKLDAFFWVGGVPTPAVTDLGATPGLKLKLIDHAEATDAMARNSIPCT